MHFPGSVRVIARSSTYTCCSTRSRLSSCAWPRLGFLTTRPSWPTSSLTRKSTQSSSPAPARQILRMEPLSTTWWLCPRGKNYLHFMFLLNLKNFFQVWFFFVCQSVRQGAVNPMSYGTSTSAFLVGKSHSEVHQDTRGFRKVNFKLSIQIFLACFVFFKRSNLLPDFRGFSKLPRSNQGLQWMNKQ